MPVLARPGKSVRTPAGNVGVVVCVREIGGVMTAEVSVDRCRLEIPVAFLLPLEWPEVARAASSK
jgi:hypothetical protein